MIGILYEGCWSNQGIFIEILRKVRNDFFWEDSNKAHSEETFKVLPTD